MSDYYYNIYARTRIEPITPAMAGEKFLMALAMISEAAPTIEWQLGEPPYRDEYLTISEARAKLVDWVESNISTVDDMPEPDFGYTLIASNRVMVSPDSMCLTACIGGRFGNSVSFRVGSLGIPGKYSDLETVTYSLFRAAIGAIVANWSCIWANAKLYISPDWFPQFSALRPLTPEEEALRESHMRNISLAPGVPPHPTSRYQRPWLSYLSAPLTAGLVPPVGVPCERTPDGGLLMIAAEERLDPTDPDHMRRSLAMAEVMIAQAGHES